ncbi:MAG TPA: DUF5985 family protein [Polyangiaceae bacterium]|nr:DUF5985 family protein [Polyangiaceae bacterium]
MAETIYAVCAAMSAACALLLLAAYLANRTRLLLWCGLCFVGLALNDVIVFVDLIVVPAVDLRLLRGIVALSAMAVLIFGLIWESP